MKVTNLHCRCCGSKELELEVSLDKDAGDIVYPFCRRCQVYVAAFFLRSGMSVATAFSGVKLVVTEV